MAFRPRSAPPPVEQPIPRLDDHPEFSRLATMRRALVAAREDRANRLELMALEAELARPTTGATGPRIAMLRSRAVRLREQAAEPKAAAPASDGLPVPIARALQLLRGEEVGELPDRDAKLKRLRAELAAVENGLRVLENMLAEVRAEQSLVIAERLVPEHRGVLLAAWEAAAALSAAIEAERRLVASVLVAGYEDRPDILRRPALDGASRLGSLADHDSQISNFRRRLEEQGVLS